MKKKKIFNKEYDKGNTLFLSFIVFIVIVFIGILIINFSTEVTSNKIALIKIKGDISLYDSEGFFFSGGASAESTIKRIERAESDPLVKAIILEINSGGGTVVATKEIVTAIKKAEKPIVAWIREVGASGAYWIASAADLIVADYASMTGSVGVRGSYLEFSELFEKYPITNQEISSGKYKEVGSPFRNLTESERQLLLNKINIIQELFLEEVKTNRGLSEEALERLSTAEIFLGVEAKELGLVDVLGSKEEAIDSAEELANIPSSVIVAYVKEKSFIEKMINTVVQSSYFVGRGIGDSFISISNEEVFLAK
ncbi:MAG: signal peptide peptidase SppA [Candidatus Woesearchaeota archaeon]|nr:MAG: signal peptide peptidase SppA [Candidatus Woesearchaeota archaeon]